jgi:hypothetical protein
MAKNETRQFLERKAKVEQALRSEKNKWIENYKGVSTVKRLVEDTGLNEQAVKRILANLAKDGKVIMVEDKSHIVLLKKG